MSGGILQRPPRPEPTRISPYFFKQLASLSAACPSTSKEPNPSGHDSLQALRDDAASENAVKCTASSAPQTVQQEALSHSPAPSRTAPLSKLFESDGAGPHRDGAGVPALIFAAPPQQQQQQQQQQPEPQRLLQDLQQVLWDTYTPIQYAEAFSTFLVEESDITEKLRHAVDEAWESVEKVTQRNADRRACLDAWTAADAAWRSAVSTKVYWQSADIVERYGLEVGGPAADTTDSGSTSAAAQAMAQHSSHPRKEDDNNEDDDENAHVLLDFSVLQANELRRASRIEESLTNSRTKDDCDGGNSGEADDAATAASISPPFSAANAAKDAARTAPQRAKAYTTSTTELLDPCAGDHPLRRLFAPLQRQRATLPRWTTLLLQDAQAIQKERLPDLEARLRESVLFKVPLHRPFLEARAALHACATQRRTAPEVEAGQVTAFRQVAQLARRLVAFVEEQQSKMNVAAAANAAAASAAAEKGNSTLPYAAPSVSSRAEDHDDVAEAGERWATAETLWTMLLTELDSCKRFLADAVPRCTDLRTAVTAEEAAVQEALRQHQSLCESRLARMKSEARNCAELLTRNGQRTLKAVAEMEEAFTPDQARLEAAIARRKTQLAQLTGQQEKNVRRVREALKACFVDQMKYEEVSQELLQDQLSLAQLQASHQQLRQAVQVRHEGAVESERHAAQLARLLEDGDTVAHAVFTACESHLRRIEDDDYFTQCRLVDQCTLAMQQRCRCLHAIAALYDQRYAALEARAGGSWQLQFLLSGEQDWAVANLADVRAELAQLEQDWATVRALRTSLDMDDAELDAGVHSPEWAAMRSMLLQMDAPAPLQRRLPTLRAHTNALTHPAAGRGPQAVRRLLTS